jgi:nucleoid-associated protein YgaU
MKRWIFYPVLASAGFVLPVVLVNAAAAEAEMAGPASESAMEAPAAEPEAGEPASAVMPAGETPAPSAEASKPAAAETPEVSAAPAPEPEAASEEIVEYVVKEGDTLGDIAREQLGDVMEWQRIAELNGIDDPAKLTVGTRLKLPSKEEQGG